MRVIGIDPGISILGYGIIDYKEDRSFEVVEYGKITTSSDMEIERRLYSIHERLNDLLLRYKPDQAVIEDLFFNKNTKTALTIGCVRGVVLLTFAMHKIRVFQYTPLQVKQSLTGYGRADKKQIQEMVKMLLNLKEVPKPDDVADAVAIALCHLSFTDYQSLVR